MNPPHSDERICYLGLGSNLGEPAKQLADACERLRQSEGIAVLAQSPVYESAAMTADGDGGIGADGGGQPKYLNAVVKCRTSCAPLALLRLTQQIEKEMGRERSHKRWQPRLIDIDILWYEGARLQTKELTLPHPGLLLRPFVLYPLNDLAPELELDLAAGAADAPGMAGVHTAGDLSGKRRAAQLGAAAGVECGKRRVKDLTRRAEDHWNTVKLNT